MLRRDKRWMDKCHPVDELFQSADDKLFSKILHNSVLQPLIPDRPPSSYGLRPRTMTNFC